MTMGSLAIILAGAVAGAVWAVVLLLLGGQPVTREPVGLAASCGAAAAVVFAAVIELVRLAGG